MKICGFVPLLLPPCFELYDLEYWGNWFWYDGAGDYIGRPDSSLTPSVWIYGQVQTDDPNSDNYGLGAVCTWKERPVRLTKLSNFIIGYAMRKMGIDKLGAQAGTLAGASWRKITTWNFTDVESVGAGWDVANGANYNTTVSTLVDYIWTHESQNDKSRKVWPNPNTPDNYKGPSGHSVFDLNTGYSVPGFLIMTQ